MRNVSARDITRFGNICVRVGNCSQYGDQWYDEGQGETTCHCRALPSYCNHSQCTLCTGHCRLPECPGPIPDYVCGTAPRPPEPREARTQFRSQEPTMEVELRGLKQQLTTVRCITSAKICVRGFSRNGEEEEMCRTSIPWPPTPGLRGRNCYPRPSPLQWNKDAKQRNLLN